MLFCHYSLLAVHAAHRDATKQAKDFSTLAHSGGHNNLGAANNKNQLVDMDTSKSGPYFDVTNSKNVTALLGKTAYLNCRVKNLGNKTVSWTCFKKIVVKSMF